MEMLATLGIVLIGGAAGACGYVLGLRRAPSSMDESANQLDPGNFPAPPDATAEPLEPTALQQEAEAYQREMEHEFQRLQRAEMDLREHQAYSESVFQAAQAGLMIVDSDTWQIMDVNESGAQILGGEPDDIIGEVVKQFTPYATPELTRSIAAGEPVTNRQFLMRNVHGADIPTMGSVTKMWGQTANLVVASFLDISEMKKKEEELVSFNQKLAQTMDELKRSKEHVAQSEKLASIGQLAAGVAHEINNPVGFVTSNIGTVQEYAETLRNILEKYLELETAEGEARTELCRKIAALRETEDLEFILDDLTGVLEESMDGVQRVAEIVKNLKSFARSDTPTLEQHDLNTGLEQMIKMTWNELKYHCTVEKDFGDIPAVHCHPGQINQVLMNMLVNASHAIGEEGGTIRVATAVVDDMVEVRISDTGKGIEPNVLPRIFDPFFTTKEVGKGTGLGLSISHGIITDHHGRIEVDSTVGEGTTFRIYLPLTGEPVAAPSPGVIGEIDESGNEIAGDAPAEDIQNVDPPETTEGLPDAEELAALFETSDEELIG